MSNTEMFRELLNEYDIDWTKPSGWATDKDDDTDYTEIVTLTEFATVTEKPNGGFRIEMDRPTPKKALEAVMGRGVYWNVARSWGNFKCSECGMYGDFGNDLYRVRFCPECGKAVVDREYN